MNNQSMTDNLIFREVQIDDAPSLTPLMDQLGYPIGEKILSENIQKYLCLPTQKAWVAESAGEVIGCRYSQQNCIFEKIVIEPPH